jgi:hypothetical protein
MSGMDDTNQGKDRIRVDNTIIPVDLRGRET